MVDSKWLKKYMEPLLGGRIIGVGVNRDGFPYFLVVPQDGGNTLRIEVSQDPEGNGPGFLFGLPVLK